jgi:hypothetical protein
MYGEWLSVRPVPPPVCCGCVSGLWMQQAYADEPVVIDALDDVSVQLELADDSGREVNPGGVQLGKSDRLVAGLAKALPQPLLLGVGECDRPIVALQRGRRRVGPSRPRRCHRSGLARRPRSRIVSTGASPTYHGTVETHGPGASKTR